VAFASSSEELRQHPEILHGAYLASGQTAPVAPVASPA
jgi:hypothetical protein